MPRRVVSRPYDKATFRAFSAPTSERRALNHAKGAQRLARKLDEGGVELLDLGALTGAHSLRHQRAGRSHQRLAREPFMFVAGSGDLGERVGEAGLHLGTACE